jgi:Xaa-Pro aminopeptidase
MFLDKVQTLLRKYDLDGYYVQNSSDVQYLTGVHFETDITIFLPANGQATLLISPLDYQMASELVHDPLLDILKVTPPRKTSEILQELVKSVQGKKWGFDDNHTTVRQFDFLKNALPDLEFIGKSEVFVEARICKDSREIEKIRAAAIIADTAFIEVPHLLKSGRTENEVAAELEYIMKKKGSEKVAFDTIVASGPRSWFPHGTATNRRIEKGDIVTIDMGATSDGYRSDTTRTFIVGKGSETARKIVNLVNDAQKWGIEAVLIGKTGKEIDDACRSYLAERGYNDDFFVHSTGHGVGIDIHEDPSISRLGERPMEEGMVITIEPGIYIPGKGGARTEDTVVVQNGKPLILTKAPIIYY